MEEKTLVSKRNITLYLNNHPLGGVIDFSIKAGSKSKRLYEIFNPEPWAVLPVEQSYVVTVKQYTQDAFKSRDRDYEIGCEINGKRIRLSGCNTKSQQTAPDASGRLVTATVITAQDMEA